MAGFQPCRLLCRLRDMRRMWSLLAAAGLVICSVACGTRAPGEAHRSPGTAGSAAAATVGRAGARAGSPLAGSFLMDLTWVSDQRGWALAAAPCGRDLCPRLAATTDGGRTWAALPDAARPGPGPHRAGRLRPGGLRQPGQVRHRHGGLPVRACPVPDQRRRPQLAPGAQPPGGGTGAVGGHGGPDRVRPHRLPRPVRPRGAGNHGRVRPVAHPAPHPGSRRRRRRRCPASPAGHLDHLHPACMVTSPAEPGWPTR